VALGEYHFAALTEDCSDYTWGYAEKLTFTIGCTLKRFEVWDMATKTITLHRRSWNTSTKKV